MAPRIILMRTYYGGAPDEDMSEILSEMQKYWEVLNYFFESRLFCLDKSLFLGSELEKLWTRGSYMALPKLKKLRIHHQGSHYRISWTTSLQTAFYTKGRAK